MRWGFTAPASGPQLAYAEDCLLFFFQSRMYHVHTTHTLCRIDRLAELNWSLNFQFLFFLKFTAQLPGNSNNHITTTLILFPLSPLLPPSQILGQKDREKFTSLSVLFFLPSLPVCLRFSSCLFVSACSSLVAVSCPVSVRRISVLLERYKSSSVLPAKTQQSSFEIQPTATSVYIEQILAQNHPILNLPSRIITSHPDFAFQ